MNCGFLVFYNGAYREVGEVLRQSIHAFSVYPFIVIPLTEGLGWAPSFVERCEWISKHDVPFEVTCLLDADMVVNRRIDRIFQQAVEDLKYPMAMLHGNNPGVMANALDLPKTKGLPYVRPTTLYLQTVPSLWTRECMDFACAWRRNTRDDGDQCDERNLNRTIWQWKGLRYMDTCFVGTDQVDRAVIDPDIFGVHGAKDVEAAKEILEQFGA